ncbi:MAG TPA: Ppx/GppA family phosphatase [bacterium]|nr:Ppx/GppA family phosphatase [bacterium]
MATHAVIDVGTNSVKMHVAAVRDGRTEVLGDFTEVTRLGEGLHETGELSDEGIARTADTVSSFHAKALELGAETVVAVGTMALRSASNTKAFTDVVRERCELEVEVVPGEEEARLSYLAVLSGLGTAEGRVVVFDTGGGSTEFIFGEGEGIRERFSLNVGSRQPTEEFCKSDPVTESELGAMLDSLDGEFDRLKEGVDSLVGMGGTVTSLGAVQHQMKVYDPDVIQGSVLTLGEVERQMEMYRSRTIDGRRETVGLMPKRADVILAGAAIVMTVMRKLGANELTISDRGLRHGLFYDRYARGRKTTPQ